MRGVGVGTEVGEGQQGLVEAVSRGQETRPKVGVCGCEAVTHLK